MPGSHFSLKLSADIFRLCRYQLAVVNYGIIDDACDNLVIGNTYCLGWEGEDCTTTYVVQANDICDSISAAAGINNTILYENNPQINDDCTNIYIGEVPILL
jgi:hypothetical protein